MAADNDAEQLRTADAKAQMFILENASEDCYGVKEFINNLLAFYADAPENQRFDHIKRVLAALSRDGLVRLDSEPMCTGDKRAPAELTISSSEVSELPVDALMPYQAPSVDVCATELTMEAHNRACVEGNKNLNWWNEVFRPPACAGQIGAELGR